MSPVAPNRTRWIIPDRLLAGPAVNRNSPEETSARLDELSTAGVTCFVDLTEDEVSPAGISYASLIRERGQDVHYLRFATRDFTVPEDWQMAAALDAVARALDAGEVVYVHCYGGVGRTRTLVGCLLAETLGSGDAAVARLDELFGPGALDDGYPGPNPRVELVRSWTPVARPPFPKF